MNLNITLLLVQGDGIDGFYTKNMAKADGEDKAAYKNIETYKKWVETLKKIK